MEYHINSRSNPRVKDLLKNRERYFFFEGEKLARDILERGIAVSVLIIHRDKGNRFAVPGTARIGETWIAASEVMGKVSSLKEEPGVIAVLEWREEPVDFRRSSLVIGLDNIQDPGNVGTVFRCAAAFGVETIALSGDSVKLNNGKFLRAAQNAFFDIRCRGYGDVRELIREAEAAGFHIYLTSSHEGKRVVEPAGVERPALVLLGNEGKGLDPELFERYPSVRIPRANRVESLNVGISACIIMYELNQPGK